MAEGGEDFRAGPEASSVELVGGAGDGVDRGAEGIDKLAFTGGLENVTAEKFRAEIGQAEFLACLAAERCHHVLAEVDVTADSRVPFSGLNILPLRAFLQIEAPLAVKYMEMDYGVEQFAAVVTAAAGGGAYDGTGLVDQRENFFGIVAGHDDGVIYQFAERLQN